MRRIVGESSTITMDFIVVRLRHGRCVPATRRSRRITIPPCRPDEQQA